MALLNSLKLAKVAQWTKSYLTFPGTGRRALSPDALTLSEMGAIPARDTAARSAMAGMLLTTLFLCESPEGDPFGSAVFI